MGNGSPDKPGSPPFNPPPRKFSFQLSPTHHGSPSKSASDPGPGTPDTVIRHSKSPSESPLNRSRPGPITVYAKKYGLPDFGLRWADSPFVKYGKSGFTPVEAESILSMQKIIPDPVLMEDVQRQFTFYGFTAREMEELGCYPDPNSQASNLTNPIHPIFAKDKWETYSDRIWPARDLLPVELDEDCYDLPPDIDPGYWEYSNPHVWFRLNPVLRHVSRYIANLHKSKWMDAYLLGDKWHLEPHLDFRAQHEKDAFPDLLRVIHHRRPEDVNPAFSSWEEETKSHLDEWLLELEKRIVLGFGSSQLLTETNRPSPNTAIGWTGCTMIVLRGAKVAMTFAIELLKPLFRKDLSPSERLAEEFFLSNVILHELGHALRNADTLWNLQEGNDRADWNFPEPYFEGEIMAEHGYSFSKSLFGGDIRSFRDDKGTFDGLPNLGFYAVPIPGKDNIGHSNTPIAGGLAALPKETIHYPIPSSHFEKVSRDNFWEFGAKKWGIDVVKPQQVAKCITTDNPDLRPEAMPEIQEAIVIRDKMSIGSKYAYFGRSDFEFEKLLTMSPPEVQLHKQALDEFTRFARLKRRKNFRAWCGHMAKAIGEAKLQWENTLGMNDYYQRRWAQRQLLNFMTIEANDELRETVAYRQESTIDDRHACFILRLNRHLRNIFKELNDNLEPVPTAEYPEFSKLIDDLEKVLNITFLLLHNKLDPSSEIMAEIPDMGPDSLAKEAETIKKTYDPQDAQNEKAEIKSILELGEEAITDGKAPLCRELGDFLNQCYAENPTLRDIGLLLIAHDERRIRRWKDCYRALSNLVDKKLVGDDEDRRLRQKWVDIGTPLKESLEKIPEAQKWVEEMKVECGKSGEDENADPSANCKVQ